MYFTLDLRLVNSSGECYEGLHEVYVYKVHGWTEVEIKMKVKNFLRHVT